MSPSSKEQTMTTKPEHIDMSPRAVAQRLEAMRALCDLMSYLARFQPLVAAAERAQTRRKP